MKFYVTKDERYPIYNLLHDEVSHLPFIELTIKEYARYITVEAAYCGVQNMIKRKLGENQ